MVSSILQDLRYASRRLRQSPAFAMVAVSIMGLGIGANTAIFSIISSALFHPLPYETPPNLVRIYTNKRGSRVPAAVSYPDFLEYRDETDLFSGAVAVHDLSFLSWATQDGSRTVSGEYYSPGFFSLLGLTPMMGRDFQDEGNRDEPVVMLSYTTWLRRFGGDPGVLGQTIRLNGHPVTVIGVGPEEFKGTVTGFEIDFFMPLRTAAVVHPIVRDHLEERDARNFFMFARLQPGVTLEQARAGMSTLVANLAKEYPETNADRGVTLLPAKDVRMHPELDTMLYPAAGFLMVVVLLVLLVACSNLANLLLIRASSRRKEFALRYALGASRGRLVTQLLTESTLLGMAGGMAGLFVASWTARALIAYRPSLPVVLALDLELDMLVLGFTALVSVAAGLLFGLAPALTASRQSIAGTLKGDSASLGLGRRRPGMKSFLVMAQVAVSLTLLIGAGLFLRSLHNGHEIDVGFETERTALATLDVSLGGHDRESAGREVYNRYCERIASSPGVEAVALASRVPLGLGRTLRPVYVLGMEPGTDDEVPSVDYAIVTEAYFRVMGVPFLRGRNFTSVDTKDSSPVVIVSETMAKRFWKRADVVGERIMLGRIGMAVPAQVIGVVRDTKVRSVRESSHPYLYVPFSQEYASWMSVIAQANADPSGMPETFRRELRALDAHIPLLESKTMVEHLGLALYIPRIFSVILTLFGALALVLASLGLYSVIASSVAQRNREVGIRIALGAGKKQVVQMVLQRRDDADSCWYRGRADHLRRCHAALVRIVDWRVGGRSHHIRRRVFVAGDSGLLCDRFSGQACRRLGSGENAALRVIDFYRESITTSKCLTAVSKRLMKALATSSTTATFGSSPANARIDSMESHSVMTRISVSASSGRWSTKAPRNPLISFELREDLVSKMFQVTFGSSLERLAGPQTCKHRLPHSPPMTTLHFRTFQLFNEPLLDVRIVLGECLRNRTVFGLENQGRAVDRIGQSAGHEKLTALLGRADHSEVLLAKGGSAVDEIIDNIVQKHVVHDSSLSDDDSILCTNSPTVDGEKVSFS